MRNDRKLPVPYIARICAELGGVVLAAYLFLPYQP